MDNSGNKLVYISKNNEKININMGCKHINYIYGEEKLVFKIEPMIEEEDIIYIPNDEIWNSSIIKWVQ